MIFFYKLHHILNNIVNQVERYFESCMIFCEIELISFWHAMIYYTVYWYCILVIYSLYYILVLYYNDIVCWYYRAVQKEGSIPGVSSEI